MPEVATEQVNQIVQYLKPLINACLPALKDFKVKMDIIEHKIHISLIHSGKQLSDRTFSVPTEMPLKDFVDIIFGG